MDNIRVPTNEEMKQIKKKFLGIHSVELRGSGRHTHTVVKDERSDGTKENVSTLRSIKVFKKVF